MRHIITIIFICSTTIIFGQRLFFAGNAVDTLKINSNSSYYHFDTFGTSTGTKDEYVIVFENNTNQYVIDIYQRTEYKVTFKPSNSTSKSKILARRQKIKNDFLKNLLTELQTKSVPPNFNNIGLTAEMFNKLTDKKHIIKIAKSQDADWHFKKKYSTGDQNTLFFKNCQNVDTFNLFLKTAFDTTEYVMMTDASDEFDIYISTNKTKFSFEGKYPNPYKQPWYDHTDKSKYLPSAILNLSINSALVNILPDNFTSLWTIKIESLTNEYLMWYLKRKRIII
jgi:hypothetical protein